MFDFFKNILKKPLWVNIATAIGGVIVILVIFFFSLGWITGNGKTEKVPLVVGLDVTAAEKNLKALGFDVELQDSIYVDTVARTAVLRQTPDADEIVKKGRTVYLTINRVVPPQIDMPNLVGFSLKSAETYLKVLGLRMGSVSFVPDRNKNVIIEQLLNGKPIAPGTKIASGTFIHFSVGDGGAATGFEVPDLTGLTVNAARAKLAAMGLLIGVISSNSAIQDTGSSFIVQQNPSPFTGQIDSLGMPMKNLTMQGASIDIVIDKIAPIISKDSLK